MEGEARPLGHRFGLVEGKDDERADGQVHERQYDRQIKAFEKQFPARPPLPLLYRICASAHEQYGQDQHDHRKGAAEIPFGHQQKLHLDKVAVHHKMAAS